MSVGFQHFSDPERPAQLEQLLVLVRRVEQDGIAGVLATDDENVVVHRADHQPVHLDLGILVMHADQPMG
jgi:ABC-type ATPase involved in cell division